MYSTCTFCHRPLGANEAIEAFPVGRKLAFDAAKGRLWVVCAACKQWNLSPLEERWEAIEAAERLYRDAKRRVTTDQVGLARMRDGTDLVRIGEPLRPEFAAWRYADRFGVRFRRYAITATVLTAGGIGAATLGLMTGAGFAGLPFSVLNYFHMRRDQRLVIARVDDQTGPITFTPGSARGARVIAAPDTELGWRLRVGGLRADTPLGQLGPKSKTETPAFELEGALALEAARKLLPHANADGGRRTTVAKAVAVLEDAGSLNAAFLRASRVRVDPYFGGFPRELRLALEMAVHEDTERRALEGELAALEASWREAEEVAAIADSLTLPDWATHRIARLRGV